MVVARKEGYAYRIIDYHFGCAGPAAVIVMLGEGRGHFERLCTVSEEREAREQKRAALEAERRRVRTARAAEEKRKADQAARDRREAEERRRLEELERRAEERERKRMHMAELEARKRLKLAENEMERKRQDATTVAADDAKRQRRSHGASTEGGSTSIDLSDPIGAYCRSHATGGATADCTHQEATVEGDDVKRQRRSHGVSAEGGSTAIDHSDPIGAYC